MNLPSPPSARLVTTDASLRSLCQRWADCSALALDTEFIRTRTFYSKLGLVQVGDPEGLYLLDAVEISDWEPLVAVFENTGVTKVLHSPSEDLELFQHRFGVLPKPLVDTQIASTLASRLSMPGCSRLVEELFGVQLPKGQQRSDWLKRPLSESQQLYAGLDVAYLLPAWEILSEEIDRLQRGTWFQEEMRRLEAQCAAKNDAYPFFRRLLKATMSEEQAGVLFAIVKWREQQARDRDLPRGFVLPDDAVLETAITRPRSLSDIKAMKSLGPGQKRKLGPGLLEITRNADHYDLAAERIDFKKVSKGALKRVRERMAEIAEAESLAPEFLASKKALEKLIRRVTMGWDQPVPPELEGWRWELFGQALIDAIDQSA